MNLSDYPALIHGKSIAIAEIDADLTEYRRALTQFEHDADSKVAFDNSLKNDQVRRARKNDLLGNDKRYTYCQEQVDRLAKEKLIALADLERLRNEFAVAKLERQLEIARAQESVLVG